MFRHLNRIIGELAARVNSQPPIWRRSTPKWRSAHPRWRPSRPILAVIGGGTMVGGVLFGIVHAQNDITDCRDVTMPRDVRNDVDYGRLIEQSRRLLLIKKEELGLPGILVGVSVNGRLVWEEGLGYSDVENLTTCRHDAAMRIASISKSITMAMAAKLMDQGKLDIDKPVQIYVPKFPLKSVNGKKVEITTRQLLCHLGGIRHYEKNSTKDSISDGEMVEFYIKDEFKSVDDALEIFSKDDLEHEPGSKYLYTTHGWTLVSAVLEGASGQDFVTLTKNFFADLGMNQSYLGYHSPLIPNQSRYYKRSDKSRLENAPLVDLSCKWAGGGMISTVQDLCKFGNAMLNSYQTVNGGYIRTETMKEMWKVVDVTRGRVKWTQNGGYGLGWGVDEGNDDPTKGEIKPFYVSHTGGACGASSVLTIIPGRGPSSSGGAAPPEGVVIALITNLQAVSLAKIGLEIGRKFSEFQAENEL